MWYEESSLSILSFSGHTCLFSQKDKQCYMINGWLESFHFQWYITLFLYGRSYLTVSREKVPDIIKQCVQLFQSDAMFLTLSDLTGLSLHQLANRNVDVLEGAEDGEECDESGEICSSTATLVGCGDCASSSGDSNFEKSKPLKKKQRLDSESDNTPIPAEMDTEISEMTPSVLMKDTQPSCEFPAFIFTMGGLVVLFSFLFSGHIAFSDNK